MNLAIIKKGIFLLLGITSVATVNATTVETANNKSGVNYRYNDAVTFVERGVEFYVFLNGDFDFDTHFDEPRYVDYYGRRTRVEGVRIERDYSGRVRRVGNTFINYNAHGNVKRIGSVYMHYRFGQLTNIGNMEIEYDRYGNPHFYGNVKGDDYYYDSNLHINVNIGDIFDYDDVYFYRRDFRDKYRKFREDDNFYYYRAVPNAKTGNRSKILKRRKPVRNVKNYDKRQHRTNSSTPQRTNESTRRNSTNQKNRRSSKPGKETTPKPTRSRR